MVVSVLISADFLRMPELVEDCIHYIASHLNQVIALPIDLSCISEEIAMRTGKFTQLESANRETAELIEVKDLEKITDRKDKLLSRLYKHKLHRLLADESSLCKCAFCGKIFAPEQVAILNDESDWLICTSGNG